MKTLLQHLSLNIEKVSQRLKLATKIVFKCRKASSYDVNNYFLSILLI